MLGLSSSIAKATASMRSYVKDNLKLYLDFKSNKSDTLKFPCEGSTYFDGTDDYIQVSPMPTTSATGSVCAWVKNSADNGEAILTFGDANADSYFGINIGDGSTGLVSNELVVIARTVTGTNSRAGFATTGTGRDILVDGGWHHVAVTGDGSEYKIYIDGVSQSINVTSGSGNNGAWSDVTGVDEFYIGKHRANGSDAVPFEGKMANVALWSRVLSAEEINSVMRKNYSQLGSVEKTSLVSWWALDTETLSDNLATAWTNASADAETLTTSGANITSLVNSSGHANVNLNAFATQYRVYKVSYDYTLVSGTHPKLFSATGNSQDGNVPTSSTFASLGSSWYYTADTGTSFAIWSSSTFSITVDNFSVKAVISADSHGSNTGYYSAPKSSAVSSHNSATTTTSVYGNNVPVLPRAVDVAKEGQADAIGNGSAFFTVADDDYIDLGNNSQLQILNALTITAWVNQTAISNSVETPIYSKGDQGSSRGVVLSIFRNDSSGGYSGFFGLSSNGTSYATQSSIPYGVIDNYIGEWIHISATYDGAGNTKIYLNGILQDSDSVTAFNINNSSQNAYIGFDGNTARTYSGSISQVGLWQGALTQAQIQSVMESTSYDKIPASVKSTLGSELVANATDWTDSNSDGLADNWSDQYSGKLDYSIVTGNGFTGNAQRFEVNDVAGSDRAIRTSATVFTSGTLYKVSFKYRASISSGSILVMDGGSGATVTNITTHTGDAKLFETYYVAPTGSHLWFYMQNADANAFMEIDEVSVKEITNDIVGYWGLDADNSNTSNGAGITNDLTTGEVLSDELVGDPSFDVGGGDNIAISGTGTCSVNTTGGYLEYTDSDASDVTFEKSNANILTSGKLYKFVFTIADSLSTGARIKITFDENSGTADSYSDHQNYTDGTHTVYTVPNTTAAIINISASSKTFKMTDISIKEVTSNTGVLK